MWKKRKGKAFKLLDSLRYNPQLWLQAQDIITVFFWRMSRHSLRENVSSSNIQRESEATALSHRNKSVEVVQTFKNCIRMPPGCLPLEIFQACPTGRRPRADPEHAGELIYLIWPWNTLGSPRRGWIMWLGRSLGYLTELATTATRFWIGCSIKKKKTLHGLARANAFPVKLLKTSLCLLQV